MTTPEEATAAEFAKMNRQQRRSMLADLARQAKPRKKVKKNK